MRGCTHRRLTMSSSDSSSAAAGFSSSLASAAEVAAPDSSAAGAATANASGFSKYSLACSNFSNCFAEYIDNTDADLFSTLKAVIGDERNGNKVLVRVDERVHDRNNGGVSKGE